MKAFTPNEKACLLDKFYTTHHTAAACLNHLSQALPDLQFDLYLEPSAGAGAFLTQLPEPRLGIDVAPGANDIVEQDFFDWYPCEGLGRIAVVGNPPFGKGGATAARFFNHAAKFAEAIALIMPCSFMKQSMQQRLDPLFHLISELPLFDEPFLYEDRYHRVSTVFQVWSRRDFVRTQPAKRATAHVDFAFVSDLTDADFVIRRVGAHAGKILAVPSDSLKTVGFSPNSNFYIKARGIKPLVLLERFCALEFEEVRRQSVAAYSISKSDLVALYEDAKTGMRIQGGGRKFVWAEPIFMADTPVFPRPV